MTDKEQIIINGKEKDCKILFRCKHIDDLEAYDMIRNGIEITPENAPVSDFELMFIEKTSSPFGFSSVYKRNNREDVWEYSGFGHSGAASIVAALLRQLARKTHKCEQREIELLNMEKANNELVDKVIMWMQKCEELKEKYKWYDHYKDSALLNKKLCDKASDERARYRKALEKIERLANENNELLQGYHHEWANNKLILEIISKAKGEGK